MGQQQILQTDRQEAAEGQQALIAVLEPADQQVNGRTAPVLQLVPDSRLGR